MSRRPKRTTKLPSCSEHTWGNWSVSSGTLGLIKHCKFCDEKLRPKEFFEMKRMKKEFINNIPRKHLDLFGY